MKNSSEKKRWITIVGAVAVAFLLTLLLGLMTGHCCLKAQLPGNAQKWVQHDANSEVTEFAVVDRREYADHSILLVNYNSGEGASLLYYHKMPILPLYSRKIIASAEEDKLTGIGFKLDHNQFAEVLIQPPYQEILMRGAEGELAQAPEQLGEE